MKKWLHTVKHHWSEIAVPCGALVVIGAAGFFSYRAYAQLRDDLARTRDEAARERASFEHNVHELSQKLSAAEQLNADLQLLLQARTQEATAYTQRVLELAQSVSELDKLSKTDRELLQKYSSVYFLNENYIPESLSQLDQSLLLRDRDEYIHSRVKPHLEALLAAAKAAKHELKIVSAYRSFGTQADLKSQYKLTYGAGTANAFSAEQGFSEHQLGSTVDLSTEEIGGPSSAFDKTEAFTWLTENAHRYGFVLSYPKGNPYFVYEPWHWRYVGIELATKLHNEGKHFYDLDQREINTYLTKIFN